MYYAYEFNGGYQKLRRLFAFEKNVLSFNYWILEVREW